MKFNLTSDPSETKGSNPQVTENTHTKPGRKRSTQLIPAAKLRLAPMFRVTRNSERVAEDFSVRRCDVIDAALAQLYLDVEDIRASMNSPDPPRGGPGAARVVMLRRAA